LGCFDQQVLISTDVDETPQLVVRLLGDPLRAEIVRLLADEQLCTCHLVELTGARQPTVSHHLKVLREAGLVEALPVGRFTYYRLEDGPLRALHDRIGRLADAAAVPPPRRRPCE
jgi:ArsR family transcriptional regulator